MGSSGKDEQDRVRSLLLDTVTLLCKNGLNFKQQMKVQGLLGITLDDDSVFIVHIDEKVGELLPEKKCEESSERSSIDSRRSSRDSQSTPFKNRKRHADSSPVFRGPPNKIKVKTEKDDEYDDEDDEDLIMLEENDDFDDKSRVQAQILHQQQTNFSTNIHSGYPSQFNPQNNMQQPAVGGFMPGVSGMPQHSLPPGPGGTPEKIIFNLGQGIQPIHDLFQKKNYDRSFTCSIPGCNASFVHKRTLRRHETEKHGRQKRVRSTMFYPNTGNTDSFDIGSVNIVNSHSVEKQSQEFSSDDNSINFKPEMNVLHSERAENKSKLDNMQFQGDASNSVVSPDEGLETAEGDGLPNEIQLGFDHYTDNVNSDSLLQKYYSNYKLSDENK